MPKNKTLRTVLTTCACGTQFDREVRRGRPQVWCDTCAKIPFTQRVLMQPKVEVKTVTDADGTERVSNQWDDNDNVRAQIEANVAEVYAEWPARRAELLASGLYDETNVGHEQTKMMQDAYRRAGAKGY